MMRAAFAGHRDAAAMLAPLSDVRAADNSGHTALMLAAIKGNTDCVVLLLSESDVLAKNDEGWTAMGLAGKDCEEAAGWNTRRAMVPALDRSLSWLSWAACHKVSAREDAREAFEQFVVAAIERGGGVDDADARGATALWHCADRGDARMAKILLAGGADPRLASKGVSPLMAAARSGHGEIVELLMGRLETADFLVFDAKGHGLLFIACASGDARSIKALAPHGDMARAQGPKGWTPLMAAVDGKDRQEACVAAMEGSDPWARAADGSTALMVDMARGGGCSNILVEAMALSAPSQVAYLMELSVARGMAWTREETKPLAAVLERAIAVELERSALAAAAPAPSVPAGEPGSLAGRRKRRI